MKKSEQTLTALAGIVSQTLSRESSGRAVISILTNPRLRPSALATTLSIFRNFFLLQYKAAFNPGRYATSQADHPLDEKIPFNPGKVDIYLDFLHFFIRTLRFLLRHFRKSLPRVKDYIKSMGALYAKAGEVYAKNYSTTNRPRYLKRFRFIVIHAFDPHLMCIPSLHIMVVILVYTQFREILKSLGKQDSCASQIEEARQRALAITEAVLYVKQHSVNCIPAAMYAMSCFSDLFPPEEAERFAQGIFTNVNDISKSETEAIRNHIMNLYRQFYDEGKKSVSWEKPLLDFLATLPKVKP